MTKYVVTGATGGLGSQVLKHLLKLVPPSDIIVSLYNPAGAPSWLQHSGATIRRGDYTDPTSLDAAFAGADKLLLISHPSLTHAPRVAHHRNAIDAARRAGVRHVYYTSLAFAVAVADHEDAGADEDAVERAPLVMRAHIDTERYLRASGLTHTILREGVYSESFAIYLGFFDPTDGRDAVVIPHGDGAIRWTSREDLGEATARIMVQGGYENETRTLVGPRSLTLHDVARQVSSLLGRSVHLTVGTEDDFVRENAAVQGDRGGEDALRKWATTYEALGRGELDVPPDPLLQDVLGRKPRAFEDTLREVLGGAA
ncbi:NmrA-like family protein [Trametes maxima]|nr:NmrA-like family protein [Trametes maxima]